METKLNINAIPDGSIGKAKFTEEVSNKLYSVTNNQENIDFINTQLSNFTVEQNTGKYISRKTGAAYSTDSTVAYYTENYYAISPTSKIYYSGTVKYEASAWAFYDENKNFIKSYPLELSNDAIVLDNVEITDIPSNAKYIRFGCFYEPLKISYLDIVKHLTVDAAIEKGRALAKRDLFIAAGALYNDTDAPITRTSPWKESVQHLPGHYYLNGLGDITEAQMAKIYNRGLFNDNDKCPLGYGSHNSVRTNLCRRGPWNATIQGGYFAYNTMAETLNLHITTNNTVTTTCAITVSTSTDQFVGRSTRLRIIDPRISLSSASWSSSAFEECTALEEVRVKNLKSNIIFKDSPVLSKASVLYMIENAKPTTAITITLHADAYARLAEDSEIIAALNEKNGYIDEEGNEIAGTLPAGASINLVSA